MEKVEAFKATDGSLFATAESCEEYEHSRQWREQINQFMASKYCPYRQGAQTGMAAKIIVAWERFKACSSV
jgi:hypothetical protein